jgi:predicted PurR-regulated permease PerM
MSDEQQNTADPSTQPTVWSKLHLWQMQPIRDVLLGLGIFALFVIGQKTSVVTVPLLLAILLAYLFEPVICWLMSKFSVSRRVSVIAIMAALVIGVVIPITAGGAYAIGQLIGFATSTIENVQRVADAIEEEDDQQVARLKLTGLYVPQDPDERVDEAIPGAWLWVYDTILDSRPTDKPVQADSEVAAESELDPESEPESIETSQPIAASSGQSSIGKALGAAIDWVSDNSDRVAETTASVSIDLVNRVLGLVGAAFGLSFMLFVTAFFFFFTATEWVQLKGFGTKLLPDKNRDRIIDLLEKFDKVISGFIRGRITIAFIQAIVFSIGYFLIGVPGAFLLGPLVAILSIVPYLALIGLPISISLLALQGHAGFRGEWWWVFGAPTVLYFVGQALDDYVWTPMIQGKSTGMDTPTILFASLAGGALFGVFGLLIAIPIAACVKILIQEIFWPRFKEWAEGRANDPLPIE